MAKKVTIVYHLGAPHTDDDQLTWSLRKDADLLLEHGTLLRRPGKYRKLIKGMRHKLEGRIADAREQDSLLSSLVGKHDIKRLILSDSGILGVPSWMLTKGDFYHNAGRNSAQFRNLFPDYPVEFFLAIRNPATFLPEAFRAQSEKTHAEFFDTVDLASIRWSDVIADIQHANPGIPITVWCNEDTPIIWPTIMASVAGVDAETRFKGELDIIRSIMSETGIEHLEGFLDSRQQLTEAQRRRVRGIVLEKYSDSSTVQSEINLTGWTEELIDHMSDVYEDDIDEIIEMPGVQFLQM